MKAPGKTAGVPGSCSLGRQGRSRNSTDAGLAPEPSRLHNAGVFSGEPSDGRFEASCGDR
jgi:hypothetical protein